MEQNFINNLDNILRFLNENRREKCFTDKEIIDFCFPTILKFDYEDLISQLKEDKYINTHFETNEILHIKISHKGRLFIEDNGYAEKIRRDSISVSLQSMQTWAIAIGTLIAGVYAFFQLLSMFSNNCNC